MRNRTGTEQPPPAINPVPGYQGGSAGCQNNVLQQRQREGALHDCRDPRMTAGERQLVFLSRGKQEMEKEEVRQ